MPEITVEQQIDASPEAVFAILTDFVQLAEIVTGIKSTEVLTDGTTGIGTKYRETRVMMGREASEDMEVTEFDPPNGFLLEAHNHGAHYRTRRELKSHGDGTLLKVTFAATANSLLAKMMMVLMPLMKKSLARCLQEDLDDIKTYVERKTNS